MSHGEFPFWFRNRGSKRCRQQCLFRLGHFYRGCNDAHPQAELAWNNWQPSDVHKRWADLHWHSVKSTASVPGGLFVGGGGIGSKVLMKTPSRRKKIDDQKVWFEFSSNHSCDTLLSH